MWKVFFEDLVLFTSKTDVDAVQFALSLHQASNVSHRIQVEKFNEAVNSLMGESVCTLIRE